MKQFIVITSMLLLPVLLMAQRLITGIVKDDNGPVANASIYEKGSASNGTTTSNDGRFRLILRGKSNTLVVSNVGFVQQEVGVKNDNNVEITLQASRGAMEDVIVVGFGKKQRITNTGSVSTIKAEEIRLVPTANVQNALSGRLPGFFSQQRGGQPGKDAADYFIRGISSLNAEGNRPLIIVDDIEYTYVQLAQINVNEIETISILKDASTTAIYGIKGANGVLVVTTRRGATGKPRVNVRSEAGAQIPTYKPKFLNAYQSALLVNEARTNDGLAAQFTQQDLEAFKNGTDPYGHPDVNWYDAIFKSHSLQANTNVDISGGTSTVKYFTSFGALTQNGSIKDFSGNNENLNTNYFFRRFNFRTNLDIQATKSLSLRLDVTGRFGMINNPNTNEIMEEIYSYDRITPFAAPFMNPNGTYAYAYNTRYSLPTLNSRLALSGYTRTKQNDLNVLFGGTQKLDLITRGLSFTGRVAYASTWDVWRRLLRDLPPTYHYDAATNSYSIDPRGKYNMPNYAVAAGSNISDKRMNIQAFLNYDRAFGDHQVRSMLLFNQNSYTNQASVPENFRGYSLSAGYNYKRKYLVDLNVGYNGSDRFQSNNRYGFFPAVSAGWNLAAEPFFENLLPEVGMFKLRASYGMVGSDAVLSNRYIYEQVYNLWPGAYSFGENAGATDGIQEGSLGNSNVTWEKKKSQNYALDVNVWKDKLSFTVEYFRDLRIDQLVFRGSIPGLLGIGTAPVNIGAVKNRGWELIATYQDKIGNVQFNITPTISVAKNTVLFKDEAVQRYPWLTATGYPINQPFGYKWIGFYENQSDIDKSAKPNTGSVRPGDLKYADLNEDGVIDQNDRTAIGKPNLPTTTAGLTLGVRYKNFSMNMLFQGAYDYGFSIIGSGIEPFQSQWQPIHLQRWTPDNRENPQFPRLTTDAASVNSGRNYMSDFWLIDAHYVRLKTLELSYQVPDNWLPLRINNARFYLSGYNLLTWTNYSKYQQDPEVDLNDIGDSYLNQRILNFGIQLGL